MKDMHSNTRFSSEIAPDFTIPIESPIESFEQPLEEVHEKDDNEVPVRKTRDKGLQNLLVMISLCTLWTILPPLLQGRMHLQMQMIGKKLFVVRWTQFFLMELVNYLSYHLVVNLWAVSVQEEA